MTLFAVTRNAGPRWTDGKGVFDQPGVDDHANFMSNLGNEGFVLFAGPLAGSERDRIRVLMVAEAASDSDVRRRLEDDPWARAQLLVTMSIEPWNLVVGADRLGGHPAAQ